MTDENNIIKKIELHKKRDILLGAISKNAEEFGGYSAFSLLSRGVSRLKDFKNIIGSESEIPEVNPLYDIAALLVLSVVKMQHKEIIVSEIYKVVEELESSNNLGYASGFSDMMIEEIQSRDLYVSYLRLDERLTTITGYVYDAMDVHELFNTFRILKNSAWYAWFVAEWCDDTNGCKWGDNGVFAYCIAYLENLRNEQTPKSE